MGVLEEHAPRCIAFDLVWFNRMSNGWTTLELKFIKLKSNKKKNEIKSATWSPWVGLKTVISRYVSSVTHRCTSRSFRSEIRSIIHSFNETIYKCKYKFLRDALMLVNLSLCMVLCNSCIGSILDRSIYFAFCTHSNNVYGIYYRFFSCPKKTKQKEQCICRSSCFGFSHHDEAGWIFGPDRPGLASVKQI